MKIIFKKSVILSSITALLFIASVNAQAKIYKWTDANGQTHYSAQPPQQKAQRIKAKDIEDQIKANAGKYRPPSKTAKTAENSEPATDSEEAKTDEEELAGPNKQLLKYCDSQRNNLKQLRKNFRNVWIDVKGNKTNLTQEQRKEKVATLQKQIKEDCSDVKVANKS